MAIDRTGFLPDGDAPQTRDAAVHPGEDATFDRTWGGPLSKYEVAAIGTGNQQIGAAGPCVLYGWNVSIATSAHPVYLRDGTSDSGAIVDTLPVSQAIGASRVFPAGIYCATGLWLDWGSATTGTLTVYYQQL